MTGVGRTGLWVSPFPSSRACRGPSYPHVCVLTPIFTYSQPLTFQSFNDHRSELNLFRMQWG